MKGNLLKDAEVNKKSLTKAEIYGIIRTYIQELHSLSDRKQKNEENFSLPAWAEHQAYQLGYQRSLEKILEFIPDEPFLTIDFPFLSRTFSGLMEKPEYTLFDDVLKDPNYDTFLVP